LARPRHTAVVTSTRGERAMEARPAWQPMHLHPVYAHAPAIGGAVAAHAFDTSLALPSASALDDDIDEVIGRVRACW
jgi:hypothetical protein